MCYCIVYGTTPLTTDSKHDLKKSFFSPSFTKPPLLQLWSEDKTRNKVTWKNITHNQIT